MGGPIYRMLRVLTKFLYLNLLWLVTCLPVVTIPAATAAMFGVIRDWLGGTDPHVAKTYVRHLRENACQSTWIGLLWALLGAVLAADFLLVDQVTFLKYPLYSILCIVAMLYVFASLYLFPVMVKYDTTWPVVVKNALLYSLIRPLTTLAGLGVVAVGAAVTLLAPPTVFITGSLTAYCVYRLCARVVARVWATRCQAGGE